ncbi:OsmC family protein [Diaphorobacter ruginosibacter]|uniref:OsmC family protein n=1 Tax=Diaphorobacter ruginosibacter TaxID=1715720 RepID=A0A7G9RIE6_9BURK|nr:OsmC family protein [Diaphorobacter ruginosibacter]QNN55371.1 OsmC family protein [Diaphorobacter ruginosibacter]
MTVRLERVSDAPMSQRLTIRDHVWTVDAQPAEGGQDSGPDPHDLYDSALGACKALTLLWYARHKGWAVQDVQTAVERDASGERSGTYRLSVRLQVSGDLSDAQWSELQRVVDKCPVHKLMTQVTTEISTALERLPGEA